MRFQLSLRESWRSGEHELPLARGIHLRNCRHQLWHVMSQFARTATRQHGHDWKPGIQPIPQREGFARERSSDGIHKWMSDPVRLHTGLSVEILLEWENAQARTKRRFTSRTRPRRQAQNCGQTK